MKLELTDKQVLVLGLGDTGLSALRWLKRHGARLSVADTRPREELERLLFLAAAATGLAGGAAYRAIDERRRARTDTPAI